MPGVPYLPGSGLAESNSESLSVSLNNTNMSSGNASTLTSVLSYTTSVPPGSPSPGDTYLIASGASGVWTGKAKQIAFWNGLSWKYRIPKPGQWAFINTTNTTLQFDGTDWTPFTGGGGASTNSGLETVDFGASFTDVASVTLTGQAWVTLSSKIVAQVLTPSGTSADELMLINFRTIISDLVAGVGFKITVYTEQEAKGQYPVAWIGL